MGNNLEDFLNEVTVNAFEAMVLSTSLQDELKRKIIFYMSQEMASIKVIKLKFTPKMGLIYSNTYTLIFTAVSNFHEVSIENWSKWRVNRSY